MARRVGSVGSVGRKKADELWRAITQFVGTRYRRLGKICRLARLFAVALLDNSEVCGREGGWWWVVIYLRGGREVCAV